MKVSVFPIIETARLILRPLRKDDVDAIFTYAKLTEVGPSAGWMPHKSLHDTYAFIEYALKKPTTRQPGVWVICQKPSDTAIGAIEIHSFAGYKGEIGFVLHSKYWNKGLITEAAKAVMMHAFENLKMKRLQYAYFLDNDASKRVCEKLGFIPEGIKRKGFLHENSKILDEMVASFTDEDYFEMYETLFAPFKENIRFLCD